MMKQQDETNKVVETEFSLETLSQMDAEFNRDVRAKLKEVIHDCLERPNIKTNRTLTIQFNFKPNENRHDHITVSPKVQSKTPPRTFEPISGKVNVADCTIKFKHAQGELFSDHIEVDETDDEPQSDGKSSAAGE